MDITFFIFLWCMLIGAVVGIFAGMLGIGGGLIIVPSLTYLLVHLLDLSTDLAMPMAIATSLSTIFFTGASSARTHYKLGNLDRTIVLRTGAGMAIGAIIGAEFATQISGYWLKNIFAVFVMLIAMQMLFGRKDVSKNAASNTTLTTAGAGVGGISALMGIGGGAILVPILVWFQVNMRQAIGCAALTGLVIAFFGSAGYIYNGLSVDNLPQYAIGYVYLPAALGIVSTSIFTANIGARLGQKLNVSVLKKIMAGLLIVVAVRMIVGIE